MASLGIQDELNSGTRGSQVVALGCKMVGGGTDGSLDLCARVCLIDEHENIIFHTYVKPQIPVTNYRFLMNLFNHFCVLRSRNIIFLQGFDTDFPIYPSHH